MTNEELELEVKRLEEQIKGLKAKLEEKTKNKPFEVKVPKDIGKYYYIGGTGFIDNLWIFDKDEQIEIFKRGLAFKSRKEAEQFDKERILINKLKDWAKKYNEDWTPNWKDFDEVKCYIRYHHTVEDVADSVTYERKDFTKLPIFKSQEIARKFIKEFGDEIKEVLC